MEKNLKVLHILHELHPSGAEMMLYNANPYWSTRCSSSVMATGKEKGPFAQKLEEIGYVTEWVPTKGNGKWAKIKHLFSFWNFMRKHHYDIVHIHRESLSFEYALLAKLTGNRNLVRTVHSTFAHTGVQRKIKGTTRHWMKKWLHVKFVAISDGVAKNEQNVFGIACDTIIYNWCNNEKFAFVSMEEKQQKKAEKKESEKLVFVTVGNCGTVKNHSLLLNAIAKMQHKENIRYHHVGYAKNETEKEKKIAIELGIDNIVSFEGSTDPKPYLEEADVFVMTSLYEGLSIAALEAIFTGMCVLLAQVPGLVEFQDKELALVDYFAAEPKALAEKLDAYVEAYQLGTIRPDRKQRERAMELYDCKTQVEKYVKLYEGFL